MPQTSVFPDLVASLFSERSRIDESLLAFFLVFKSFSNVPMSQESYCLSRVRLQCEFVFLRKEHHHHVLVTTFLHLWRETSFWLMYMLPQSAVVVCESSLFGSFFDDQDLLLIKLKI